MGRMTQINRFTGFPRRFKLLKLGGKLMIEEKNLRATIGWLCTAVVFSMYIFVPTLEFFLDMDLASHTSTLFAFLSALFMDAAKPVRETKYRGFWLDGWLCMVGWICALVFSWAILIHLLTIYVLSIFGLGNFANGNPIYSMGELIILAIIMLRAVQHQVYGKLLSDTFEALLSKLIRPQQ